MEYILSDQFLEDVDNMTFARLNLNDPKYRKSDPFKTLPDYDLSMAQYSIHL